MLYTGGFFGDCSLKIEGLVSRYTYLAPVGRAPAELLRNYKLEFQRLGLATLYEKAAGAPGWFGATLARQRDRDRNRSSLEFYSPGDFCSE